MIYIVKKNLWLILKHKKNIKNLTVPLASSTIIILVYPKHSPMARVNKNITANWTKYILRDLTTIKNKLKKSNNNQKYEHIV